jgi:hypothetical protein
MSKDGGKGGKDDVIQTGSMLTQKPKNLLDAISAIQWYYAVESGGSAVPQEFFTLRDNMEFYWIGLRSAVGSAIIGILMTPFFMGVIEKYIPVFGSNNPSAFDVTFTIFLALSFSLGYSLLLACYVGRYYFGTVTKQAIRQLIGGFSLANIGKMFFAIILYNFIYFKILEKGYLTKILHKMYPAVKYETLNKIYVWALEFREVFITSTVFVVLTTILVVILPIIGLFYFSRKTKKRMKKDKTWD